MARWTLEPGHTEAELRARHMMATWVRGLFKGHPRLDGLSILENRLWRKF